MKWKFENGILTVKGDSVFLPVELKAEYVVKLVIREGSKFIDDYAFKNCINLVSVSIPSSVVFVKEKAFYGCRRLEKVEVTEGNKFYRSIDGVLFNNTKTVLSLFPAGRGGNYCIPSTVTFIGDEAFCGCKLLESVSIPDSVLRIGERAFAECIGLDDLRIPESVQWIENDSFAGCAFEDFLNWCSLFN